MVERIRDQALETEIAEHLGAGRHERTEGRRPTADPAATLARRGQLHFARAGHDAAEADFRRSLRLHREVLGPRNPETLRVQGDFAWPLHTTRELEEAEALLRGILASVGEEERESSPFALEVASQLGYVLFEQTRYDEAVGILRPTLARQRQTFGETYAPALATLRFLGSALRDRGDLEEAEAIYRDPLPISQALYCEEHLQTAVARLVLAIALLRMGELEEAETLTRRALAVYEQRFGPEHLETAYQLIQLAQIRLDRGDPVEAESLLRRANRIFRRTTPPGRLDEGPLLNHLAFVTAAREAPDADRFYREAVEFNDSGPAGYPVFVSGGFHFLAPARHRKGDLAGAEAADRRALDLYRRQLPAGHPYRAAAATGLGAVLLDAGRPGEAEPYLREGLAQWEAHGPPDPARIAETRALLQRALAATRR